MSPVCKMADDGRLTVDQMVNVVLFYAETKSVVATQRRFARGCEVKMWSHWTCSSLGKIFQPMRINSVPRVKTIKMCYVYNQWYDISCATLYLAFEIKLKFSQRLWTAAALWLYITQNNFGTINLPLKVYSKVTFLDVTWSVHRGIQNSDICTTSMLLLFFCKKLKDKIVFWP